MSLSNCPPACPSHNSARHARLELVSAWVTAVLEGWRVGETPPAQPPPAPSSSRQWGMCSTVPLPAPSRPTALHHSSCLLPRHAATDGTCPEILLWEHARELCTYNRCALGSCTRPLHSAPTSLGRDHLFQCCLYGDSGK